MNFEEYKTAINSLVNSLDEISLKGIVQIILDVRDRGNTIFIAGNGGSAATSSHLATDLMFGSNLINPFLKVISLVDNNSIITATGNDLGFENLFSRQITALGKKGDLAILISASGNSSNIIDCARVCKTIGITTVGFTGFDGGELLRIVDISLHTPTDLGLYGVVEDMHMITGHMITELLKLKVISETGE